MPVLRAHFTGGRGGWEFFDGPKSFCNRRGTLHCRQAQKADCAAVGTHINFGKHDSASKEQVRQSNRSPYDIALA